MTDIIGLRKFAHFSDFYNKTITRVAFSQSKIQEEKKAKGKAVYLTHNTTRKPIMLREL
jgi:hypothetical protein